MKQTKTTLKELTAMYRAVLRHGILCNAIALGLIATAPAMANNDPNTTGNAWVFGDIVLADAPVSHATIGGRRMDWNEAHTKYQNDIPAYNMVGQSLSVTNSNMYVGPVTLELREIDAANDTFAYNYQWDTDGDGINNDVDLAAWAGVGWNEDYTNAGQTGVYDKVAAKINSTEPGAYDNAGDTAPGVYMFSRLDTTHANAGKMSFDGSTVTVNGTTVNADSISVTNGSQLTFTKETTLSLEDFNGGDIDSDGKTTLNAGTINIDGSRMTVKKGAELTINPTTSATIQNSSSSSTGGAIYATDKGSTKLNIHGNTTFSNNSSALNAGAIYNETKALAIGNNDGDSVKFISNHADGKGGALFSSANTPTIKNTEFKSNSAGDFGGAIALTSGGLTISDTQFNQNTAGTYGGAIAHKGPSSQTGMITLTDTDFTGNHAAAGGAIYQDLNTKGVAITNGTFDGNYATEIGAVGLFGLGLKARSFVSTIDGTEFKNNYTTFNDAGAYTTEKAGGGALFLGAESQVNINGATFSNNTSTLEGGAISTRNTANSSDYQKLSISDTSFTGNKAGVLHDGTASALATDHGLGGAIYANVWHDAEGNDGAKISGSTFTSNEAVKGGAIYNDAAEGKVGSLNITDTSFASNTATTAGGAIYNVGTIALNATGENVSFSGNTANGSANDIYNTGTLALNAAAGKTISLAGGIDGDSGITNITGAGTVETSTIKNQTVAVNSGELHLTNADLTGSTVNVAGGAIINTIDNVIQDLSANITLADGAEIMGDVDLSAGTADKYAAANGTSVKYRVGNLVNDTTGTSDVQVASDGVTVDIDEAKFTSDTGAIFMKTGLADGKIRVTAGSGGIADAADATETVSFVDYSLTADESLDTDKEIKSNFVLNGDGTESTDKGLTLNADLGVANGADLTLNEVKLAGDGELRNAAGATLRINDSKIGVNIRNFGLLYSDPTTFSGVVDNAAGATSNFDNDTFDATAELANAGTANLKNNVTFETGAQITGTGTVNMLSGTTAFNNTANTNYVTMANGASFSGTLIGGSLDTRNNNIDTGLGTVQNANLYVDANLKGTATIDSFAGTTGSTIKAINLTSSEYGTADSITLAVGDATLSDDLQITGAMNYYTKVEKDGTNLVFSDKLVNASGMKANARLADYDNTTSGLTAATLQGAIDENATNVATINTTLGGYGNIVTRNVASDFTGSTETEIAAWVAGNLDNVADVETTFGVLSAKLANVQNDLFNGVGGNTGSIANALGAATGVGLIDQVNAMADARIVASTVDAADLHTAILTIDGSSAEAKDKRNALGALLTTGANAGKTLTAASTAEAVAEYMKLSADVMSQYDFGWDLNTGLQNDLVAGKMKIDVLNDASVTDKTVAGAINANTAAIANIATTATTAWNHAEAWMNTALGIDSTTYDADEALQAALTSNDVIGTADNFADALSALDAQTYANKNNIGDMDFSGGTYISGETTLTGAALALDGQVKTINDTIGTTDISGVGATLTAAIAKNASDISTISTGVTDLQNEVGAAQTTAATTGLLSGQKIGDDVSLVSAIDTIATSAAGLASDNTFTGDNTFAGDVSVGGDLAVTGATTLTGLLTANGGISTTDISAATVTTTGDATVGGDFAVTGATTLTGALNGSTATFSGALSADSVAATNGVSAKTLSATDSITLGSNTVTSIDTAGLARGVAGNTGVLATTASVTTTIANQAQDATYTNTITTGSNVTGATLNAAIANLDATIGNMGGLSVRDDENSVGNALANGGTTAPTTVVAALNNIDATLGTVHNLSGKLTSAGTYKGNLAGGTTTTVEDHLVAVDTSIGDRSSLASLNTAINNAAKTDVATALETTGNLIGNMTFDGSNYLASVTDLSEAVRVLDSNIAKVDHKVEKLEKKVNSGMASVAALTALVPNARDCGDTQISIGTGAYADRAGVAVGAFHYFNDHVLLNVGASYGGTSDMAFRAGITFGL